MLKSGGGERFRSTLYGSNGDAWHSGFGTRPMQFNLKRDFFFGTCQYVFKRKPQINRTKIPCFNAPGPGQCCTSVIIQSLQSVMGGQLSIHTHIPSGFPNG